MNLHEHSDDTVTAVFSEEEGEQILENLARIRSWVESPMFQPNHHMPLYKGEFELLKALATKPLN